MTINLDKPTAGYQPMTTGEIQKQKLSALFKLKANVGITPGCLVKSRVELTGVNNIEKTPWKPGQQRVIDLEPATLEFNEVATFSGVFYDQWSTKIYLEFIGNSKMFYYSYTDHGPFSIPFEEMFELYLVSGEKEILK